jgi:hypothetical protein
MTASVPVLLITGPVGVGKSTIAAEAARLLREADVPHALVDLDRIEECWPVPADDPWNERLSHRNLACMWANFRDVGADRLLLVRVLEARSLLRKVTQAVPGAEITVVRLRAPLAVLHARIRSREASDPSWFLGAATHTAEVLEQARVEDHLVDNEDRPAAEVAEEVLRRAGWLDPGARAERTSLQAITRTGQQGRRLRSRDNPHQGDSSANPRAKKRRDTFRNPELLGFDL